MKVDVTKENILVLVPENSFELMALNSWHGMTIGLKSSFASIDLNDLETPALLIANTEEGIANLDDLEPEDE